VQIAIISDTHLPRGARRLPESCRSRLEASDLIIHAGDFVALPVLEMLRATGDLAAVAGNVDDGGVRAQLRATAVVPIEGVRIGVIHDAGPARGRLARLRARFPRCDAVVFGHSHIPLREQGLGGFQIFNPGSPTDRRRARSHTMGIATVRAGRVRFETIELD
jgi:putative phosphoesterase